MTDVLTIAKKYFSVNELQVPDEFKTIKTFIMKTNIDQYYVEGLGNVTFQHAKVFFGLMKMEMMCITPIDRDLPLLSYDLMDMMGKQTLIIELADCGLQKQDKINEILGEIKPSYDNIPNGDRGEHWYDDISLSSSVYKEGKKKDIEAACDELYGKYMEAYFEYANSLPELSDKEAKRVSSDSYVQGLLDNGGPSTDLFVKLIGKEKTVEYYKKYIFGTER